MPQIKSINTHPYHVPLKSSLSWGKGHQLSALEHVLIVVELSDGSFGLAEATPRPTIYGETANSVAAIMKRELAPRSIGYDIDSLDAIHSLDRELVIVKNNNTAKGALNMALFSAFAKSSGKRLSELLNCSQNNSFLSFILGTGDTETVLQEVHQIYKQEVRCLKVKVGKDHERELALIKAIRNEFDDMQLYADANQCFLADNAAYMLEQLAGYDIAYCEEPLPVNDLISRQELQNKLLLPIVADDSCFTLLDVEREIAFNTFDILNIKTARTGYSQSLSMLELVQTNAKGVMVGSQASSILGCLYAAIFACQDGVKYPTEASFFLKTQTDFTQPKISEGYLDLAEAESTLYDIEDALLRQHGYQ